MPASAIASGVGNARPQGVSGGAPAAGSPRFATIAWTMRTVADHVQFVVQIVFTTSSNTLALRTIRPAPVVTHDSCSSSAAAA